MDELLRHIIFSRKTGSDNVKEWKKVKVFEDLTQESSVIFSDPYTELIIISENLKGENGSQLIKYLNNQMISGQNGDISSTTGFNCIDFIECITDGYIRNTHLQRQQYPTLGLGASFCSLANIGTSEFTSLRIAPQYKTFISGKATVYAR